MSRKQKYEQNIEEPIDATEHKLHLGGSRRYDPDGGASAESGAHFSLLTELCSGDWSWKPARDKRLGKDMRTFLGVPRGAAELYGPRILS